MSKDVSPSYSQAVGQRKKCDETAFHRMCNWNVSHLLLVMIGKDVMRLPFT